MAKKLSHEVSYRITKFLKNRRCFRGYVSRGKGYIKRQYKPKAFNF